MTLSPDHLTAIAIETGKLMDICLQAAREAGEHWQPGTDQYAAAYRFRRAQLMRGQGFSAERIEQLNSTKPANQRHFESMARDFPHGNWPEWARPDEHKDKREAA